MVQCKHCHKEYSKQGIRVHEMYCTGSTEKAYKNSTGSTAKKNEVQNQEATVKSSSTERSTEEVLEETRDNKKFQEVNMNAIYTEKKQEIEPIKEQKKEEEQYQCGACQAVFNRRHKYCPECGVGFE